MIEADIGGSYLRVADPEWADPLDAGFAQANGGRWNAAGEHAALYLNADEATARANVRASLAGLPYGPEDLDPDAAPLLVEVLVPAGTACEARTKEGLTAVRLPTTYPVDHVGRLVPWDVCQPIGGRVFAAGLDGVACRSAAPGGVEELAWFPRPGQPPASAGNSYRFDDWYWPPQAVPV